MRWPHSWSRNLPLFRAGLDLAFPPQCAACETLDELLPETLLCSACWQNFYSPMKIALPGEIRDKTETVAAGEFSGSFRNLILRAKYNADSVAVVSLIRLLSVTLGQQTLAPPHFITQVPADPYRLRNRGFYLPSYLAKKLSKSLNLRHDLCALTRTRSVPAQSKLTREDRLKNLEGVFRVNQNVEGQNILVIDDVVTTGATAAAVSSALLDSGANRVMFFALARTPAD